MLLNVGGQISTIQLIISVVPIDMIDRSGRLREWLCRVGSETRGGSALARLCRSCRLEPCNPFGTSSEDLWTKVPELIRRDVEQHVLAHLPAYLVTKWRDQHARGVRIGSDDLFFILAPVWLSGISAANSSQTVSWQLVGSCSIGTAVITVYSPR